MMNAREAILQKLQSAAQLRKKQGGQIPPRPNFNVMERAECSLDELCDEFEANIKRVNAEVYRTTQSDLTSCLQQILHQKNIRNLLLAKESFLSKAFDSETTLVTHFDRVIEEWKDELFNEIDAAITSTLGAIAETGSLVLWPTTEEPRLMSLVPPIHIALLYKHTLKPSFWHFMKEEEWDQSMPTNALLISGPSKTADIEQTLAYGVHGPKELIVVIIE